MFCFTLGSDRTISHHDSDELPPMATGLFGYFGYEMVHHMERLPNTNPDLLEVPNAILMRPMIVVIFDRLKDEMTVCTPLRPDKNKKSAESLWQEGYERLERIVSALNAPMSQEETTETNAPSSRGYLQHEKSRVSLNGQKSR